MIVDSVFQAVSIGTTTGFLTSNYSNWPLFVPIMLLIAAFIGACAGSTGGGIKVIRALILIRQGSSEITKLIHPNAVVTIKFGKKSMLDSFRNNLDLNWLDGEMILPTISPSAFGNRCINTCSALTNRSTERKISTLFV